MYVFIRTPGGEIVTRQTTHNEFLSIMNSRASSYSVMAYRHHSYGAVLLTGFCEYLIGKQAGREEVLASYPNHSIRNFLRLFLAACAGSDGEYSDSELFAIWGTYLLNAASTGEFRNMVDRRDRV